MKLPASAKAAVTFALLITLASCSFRIEQMRIHLDNEKHGSLVFTASTNVKFDEDGKANPKIKQHLQKLEQRLQSCGLGTALFEKGGDYWFNARMVFNYPHEATSALGCAPTAWNDMDLQVDKGEGILWDRYTTKLLFSQPRLATPEDSNEDGEMEMGTNHLGNFPRVLRITLPGHIDTVTNRSTILGGHVAVEESGPSTVQVTFDHDYDGESEDSKVRQRFLDANIAAFKAGKLSTQDFEKQGSDILALSVVTYERKYELKDLLSILGVLFGSGFLLQLVAKWFARRPSGPPGPAA